ncbi:hypothetical protein [Jannaschia aquimarina]|uniref:Uncharacterized protein n=1 Tax=Jannaschia aquimarina TaxID=935700 RepID=A0A0D1DBS0_9RHOB|nr:hypothetical protein [Jannaschia aquimarina]KIT17433.1 hypothetical protein jaqu_08480 [Jannaschia aquimarina]SNT23900.1 hypothetical protein SAMN05421775_108154 [Jannaschia aquimarina]
MIRERRADARPPWLRALVRRLLRRLVRRIVIVAVVTLALALSGTSRMEVTAGLSGLAHEFVVTMNAAVIARRQAEPGPRTCKPSETVIRGNMRFERVATDACRGRVDDVAGGPQGDLSGRAGLSLR